MPQDTSAAADHGDTVIVVLPPPHPVLHAHNTGHFRKKAGFVFSLRQMAQQQIRRITGQRWQCATITYRFFFADHIRRDQANAIHSQKPAIDGIVDSGFLPDDDWKHLSIVGIECTVDPSNPRTELVFRRLQ